MDSDHEIAKAKWLLFAGVLFLVSAFISYGEFVYLISGHSGQATVTDAYTVTKRRYFVFERTRLTVDYTFTEADGMRRKGSDTVSPDWDLPVDGTIQIRYTPGVDGRSRLAGHVNWVGIIIFVLSIAVLVFAGIRLWQKASAAVGPTSTGRK